MSILSDERIREIETEFCEDMATWWDNATDDERMNLTNSPEDLTSRQLKAQDLKSRADMQREIGQHILERCSGAAGFPEFHAEMIPFALSLKSGAFKEVKEIRQVVE